MNFRIKSFCISQLSPGARWVSFTLFWTIDMLKAHTPKAGLRPALEMKRAELRSAKLCPVNGRSCRRSSCSPAELYPPHELTNFIMLNGRVFDARNLSFQPRVGAILTREWARFRLTKTELTGPRAFAEVLGNNRIGFRIELVILIRRKVKS